MVQHIAVGVITAMEFQMSLEHSPAKGGAAEPVDPMLRTPEVLAAMGWSRTTLWRRVRAGVFPAPAELGPNINGWRQSWVNAARDALPRRTYGAKTPYEPSKEVTA